MKHFNLFRSGPRTAQENMECDRMLFERYCATGIPAFRVYRWQAPSFTYGVSQDPAQVLDLDRCKAMGAGIARRMTGGGVLFHHDEITYSFACSKEDVGEPSNALVSYRQICAFLLRFYASLGVHAGFAKDASQFSRRSLPSGICCASHEKFDIVVNGKKLGGNAQKRRRQAVFQHGSIPCSIDWTYMQECLIGMPQGLRTSVIALDSQLAVVPDKAALEDALIAAFAREFGVTFTEEAGCACETCLA